MVLDVPEEAAGISAAWLRELCGFQIQVDSVSPIADQGTLARIFRIQGGSDPLILKLPLCPSDPRWRFGEMLDVWRREARFYADIGPLVDVRIPRVYGNRMVSDRGSILLLEDLTASGFTSGDQQLVEIEALHDAVEWLACLHRSDLPRATLQAVPHDGGATGALLKREFTSGWDSFRAGEFGQAQRPAALDALERRSMEFDAILGRIRRTGSTFRHGDARLANLFFSDEDNGVAGIDWQMCSVGIGAHDLAYLLTAAADVAVPSLQDTIDHYVDARGSTRNAVERDLRHVIVPVLMAVVASGPRATDELEQEERKARAATVTRAFELAVALDFGTTSSIGW